MKKRSIFPQKTICLMFVIVTLNSSYAQNDSTNLIKKNEIGLNIGPVLLFTCGDVSYPQPIGVTYKRIFGKWAFRSNFTLRAWDNYGYFFGETQMHDTVKISLFGRNSISYIGRVGCEYRHKNKRGWYYIGGMDLQAQQKNVISTIGEATFKIDSISMDRGFDQNPITKSIDSRSTLLETEVFKQVGLGFSIGLMIPVGKRFLIAGQYRADSFFGPTKTITRDDVAKTTTTTKTTSFDFTTGPSLTEVSMFYRF